MAVLNIRYLIR